MIGPPPRRFAGILSFGALLVIGFFTLGPVSTFVPTPRFCIVCGTLGGVDFTLNILLFAPLGLGLRWLTGHWSRAVVIGFATSLAIELLQWRVIPGRDASLGDLVSNTSGTLLGAWMATAGIRWLNATGRTALRLGAAFAGGVAAIIMASALLLRPAAPTSYQVVRWKPVRPNSMIYPGQLLSLELNQRRLEQWDELWSDWLRQNVRSEYRIKALITGPTSSTPRRALLVRIANPISEGFVLAQQGQDLLFRTNTRATQFRMRPLIVRLKNGLLVATSDSEQTALEAISDPRAMTLSSQRESVVTKSTVRRTIGWGWTLLTPSEVVVDESWWPANALWLGLLIFPVAFFIFRSRHGTGTRTNLFVGLMPAVLVLLAIVGSTTLLGLSPLSLGELFGPALGVAAAWLSQRFADTGDLTNLNNPT